MDIGLIQIYVPTADTGEEEVEIFYETFKKAVIQLKSRDIKIVMGDFNSKVGSKRTENITGPFGIGGKNERGGRLIEFRKERNFRAMNTWFRNHP